MQQYIKALRDYCKQNPLNHGDAESVMEFLYWHYAEFNPIDNQKIRDGFSKIRQQYSHLSCLRSKYIISRKRYHSIIFLREGSESPTKVSKYLFRTDYTETPLAGLR